MLLDAPLLTEPLLVPSVPSVQPIAFDILLPPVEVRGTLQLAGRVVRTAALPPATAQSSATLPTLKVKG